MKLLVRIIAILLFTAVVAGTWDVWWHGSIGRDTFWEPPHLLLYSSIMAAIVLGLYGWRTTREKKWKNLSLTLLLILVAAPFDELWHRIFGVEDISSPLIVWSPPHLTIVGVLIASMVMVLPLLKNDKKDYQLLFGTMLFAAIANVALFVASPLQPEGPWHLLGFWGTIVPAFIFVTVLTSAHKWLKQPGGTLITAGFMITISSITFNERLTEGIVIAPHEHIPPFLAIFSILLMATAIELVSKPALRGFIAGTIWAGLTYGLSWWFFSAGFQYSFTEGFIAVLAGAIGGLLGSFTTYKLGGKTKNANNTQN